MGSEGPYFAGLSDRTAPARCIPLMSPAAGLNAGISFFTSLHATGRRGAGVARWRLVFQSVQASRITTLAPIYGRLRD